MILLTLRSLLWGSTWEQERQRKADQVAMSSNLARHLKLCRQQDRRQEQQDTSKDQVAIPSSLVRHSKLCRSWTWELAPRYQRA